MDTSMVESTQQMLRPGKCVDLYYPDPETAQKQCFRTTVNTKFSQAFTNLAGGVSTFTLPPSNGYSDIMCIMKFPSAPGNGLALPRAWGYAAIRSITYRIGGSSQYSLSGAQMLQQALESCPDAAARDSLYSLGGQSISGLSGNFTDANTFAYVWLKLPFTVPSAEGKLPPLPSDLLTQQVVIQVELNPLSAFVSNNAGTVPAALQSASFFAQQVQFQNQGDSLARRVDMTSNSLSYPVSFIQQQMSIPLNTTAASQTVSISGFRSGEVKALKLWITSSDDAIATAQNPLLWYRPTNVVVTYAGDQYARYDADSGALWNLVNGKFAPEVAGNTITFAGGAYVNTPASYGWLSVPFAQAYSEDTAHTMYVSGKEVLNGVVQIQLTVPATASAKAGLVLNVSAVYNSVLVFGSGTCDYAF